MLKNIVIILLLSFSVSKDSILILYPDANLSNTEKLNASDVDAIYFLFQEGFNKKKNFCGVGGYFHWIWSSVRFGEYCGRIYDS